ncbi:zf-HC2 domain-containing protein [Kitasatospora sp. NPDC096147]|uniref:zf-HC2 domain-containing protein n=1 Tax=Kitasatospora sp. NPDC096147 TaxID=3364093 RepID=UPI0038012DFD
MTAERYAGHPEGHLAVALLADYSRGAVPAGRLPELERHLDGCASCRDALAAEVSPQHTEARWQVLSEALDEPARSRAERLLLRLGVPDHWARLALATPVLRRSWLIASVVTLLFAVVAARLSPDVSATALLLAAPLIPVAGVAMSYGPAFDPMYELGLVMPLNSLRLVLLRSALVLTTSTVLSTLMTLVLPGQGLALFGWLAPSVAVTSLTLALSAHLDPTVAARAVGAGWIAVVAIAAQGRTAGSFLLTGTGQGGVALLALASAGLITFHRHRFSQAPRRPARHLTT